jgi:hypothetical protein
MIIRRKHWYPVDACRRCKGVSCNIYIFLFFLSEPTPLQRRQASTGYQCLRLIIINYTTILGHVRVKAYICSVLSRVLLDVFCIHAVQLFLIFFQHFYQKVCVPLPHRLISSYQLSLSIRKKNLSELSCIHGM